MNPKRNTRHKRVRAKIHGTKKNPRLCVFRSAKYLYAQLINDDTGKILAYARGPKTVKQSYEIGIDIAKKAIEQNIGKIVFDRGGYKYHGRVKALADGAREGGLKF